MLYRNIILTNSGNQLNEETLIAFEQTLHDRLPEEYRQFLLEVNGGQPEPNAFPIQNNPHDTFGLVERFFSLAGDDTDYDLQDNLETFKNRVPADLVPIAFDPGGNLLCLVIRGDKKGVVYFWDHNDEVMFGEVANYHNVYFVAANFDEWLANLTSLPE